VDRHPEERIAGFEENVPNMMGARTLPSKHDRACCSVGMHPSTGHASATIKTYCCKQKRHANTVD